MRQRRDGLRELRVELESWSGVSSSARAFHRACRVLSEDLHEQEGRFFSWGAGDVLVELEERASRLRPIAEGLGGLFERVAEAEALLSELGGPAAHHAVTAQSASEAVDQAAISRWRVALGRTGEAVRTPADLDIERRQLEDLWVEMVTERERIRSQFQVSPTLPPPIPSAAVADPRAPAVANSLAASSPSTPSSSARSSSPSSSQQILRAASQQQLVPQQERIALRQVEQLGQQLWEWARVVPEHRDAVSQLSSRKEDAASRLEAGSGDGESTAQVLAAAEELLAAIIAGASAERQARRERLGSRLQTFSLLIVHSDLEQQAEALFAREVTGGREHRDWLNVCDQLESVLRDRLHNDHRRVAEAFDAAVRELREGLAAPGRRLLAETTAAALEGLASELRELAPATGVEARFDALDRLRGLRTELEQWSLQARQEQVDFRERQGRLMGRVETLETHLSILPAFTLAPELTEIRDGDLHEPASTLEAAGHALDQLDALVTAEETRFVEACDEARRNLGDRNRTVASVLDVAVTLELLAANAVPAAGHAPSGQDPVAAASFLEAARRRRRHLDSAHQEALASATERLSQCRAELAALDEARLRPGERREREVLIAEIVDLESGASLTESAAQDWTSLENLLAWLRRQNDLVDRVEGERRRALQLRHQLVSRLEALERQRLAELCPRRLVERAHALVHGLDKRELEDPAVAAQLGVAETLLGRLESHSRHLLACELERARDLLTGDPSPTAQAALAELAASAAGELPSPALRRRLFSLTANEGAL